MADVSDGEGPAEAQPREIEVRPLRARTERSAVDQGIRLGFGLVALVTEVVLQSLTGTESLTPGTRRIVDAGLGAGWGLARLGGRVTNVATVVTTPVVRAALHPPLLPHALHAGTALETLTVRWQADRVELAREASRTSAIAVPAAVDAVASTVDLDELVLTIVDRVDLDRIVAHVMRRVDLDTAVSQAVNELDLTPIISDALDRVDLQPIVDEVIGELDLAGVVAQVLEQLDLTTIVVDRVDLGEVVNRALDSLDLTALVMERVDLVGVADYVVDAIDLPGIVRESTGSIASETVRTVRIQAADADRVLARLVDRMTMRGHRQRRLNAPGNPESATAPREDPAAGGKPGE